MTDNAPMGFVRAVNCVVVFILSACYVLTTEVPGMSIRMEVEQRYVDGPLLGHDQFRITFCAVQLNIA